MWGSAAMTSPRPKLFGCSLPIPAVDYRRRKQDLRYKPAAVKLHGTTSAKAYWRAAFGTALFGCMRRWKDSVAAVRENQSPLFISGMWMSEPVNAQLFSATPDWPSAARRGRRDIILMEPREIAGRLGRANEQQTDRSEICHCMAEMLAHRIKNPLAGINGSRTAFLGMNLPREKMLNLQI